MVVALQAAAGRLEKVTAEVGWEVGREAVVSVVAGWAPHESQQQPLKPGSAKASLAEALGTVERKL